MLPLDKSYLERLEIISNTIQQSDELAYYLSEEEDTYYEQLKERFEPYIEGLYNEVADDNPLQLTALDQQLMKEEFEGLFLPRILGYSVLRGEYNKEYKYILPQDHFKDVLIAICYSPNFDMLKKRSGQSIQIGFAMSSDIWITNLLDTIDNKRIKYFLQSQKLDKYRTPEGRAAGLRTYKKQFQLFNYMSASFPKSVGELKVLGSSLKEFLLYRIVRNLNNNSLMPYLKAFIENEDFQGEDEHLQVMGLYASFFSLNQEDQQHLALNFNKTRQKHPNFIERWLEFVLEMHESTQVDLNADADNRISAIVKGTENDELTGYYKLMDVIHSVGYMQEETMEAVKDFYNRHEGRSLVNECVRMTIFHYFERLLNNLEVTDYPELFELAKVYTVYINIFANQQFNQDVKYLSLRYIHRLLKHYTDKRGKDYQDIKKFVTATFQDLKFLSEKEIVEMFKTRRKKKQPAS